MGRLQFHLPPRTVLWALLLALGMAILYIVVYSAVPFPEPWSDYFLVWLFPIAAIAAAVLCTLVSLHFQRGEPPRRVWTNFALGLGCWALAEVIYAIYYVIDPDVPAISWTDAPWVLGHVPYALAFIFQYRLLFNLNRKQSIGWLIFAFGGVMLGALLGAWLMVRFGPDSGTSWVEVFLSTFYVAADLAMMIAAVGLARLFGRGLWGQAWVGLMAFTLSDGLYSVLDFSGLYGATIATGNWLTLLVDTVYLEAYLLMALACYVQYLLMRYGPALEPQIQDGGEPVQ